MTALGRWFDRIPVMTIGYIVGWGALALIAVLVIAGSWWIGMWKP